MVRKIKIRFPFLFFFSYFHTVLQSYGGGCSSYSFKYKVLRSFLLEIYWESIRNVLGIYGKSTVNQRSAESVSLTLKHFFSQAMLLRIFLSVAGLSR